MLKGCRFTPEHSAQLDVLYNSELFSSARVGKQRANSTKCPEALPHDEVAHLADLSPLDCNMKLDYSPLAKQVAGLRKHFQGCVFAVRNGVNWSYNMLLLVVMQ
eukprot:5013892-Amphidinium_carterae.1